MEEKTAGVGPGCNEQLGPLPDKSGELWELKTPKGKPAFRYWTADDVRAYAAEQVAAERERLLSALRKLHDEAGGQHSYYLHAATVLGKETQ